MGVALHAAHQIVLAHVGGVDHGLGRQKAHLPHQRGLLVVALVQSGGAGVFALTQMLGQLVQPLSGGAGLLVAGLGGFGQTRGPVRHHFQVAENQLGVDGLNVAQRVHAAFHVHNVGAVKAANHMHNGVAFPNVAQELVAQALALGRALYKARNVHKFHNGRCFFIGVPDFGQLVQPGVRHGHDAGVGVDGAEGVVGRRRVFGAGDGVEQGAFAYVGQAHNAELHSNEFLFSYLVRPRALTFSLYKKNGPGATRRGKILCRAGKSFFVHIYPL